MSRGTPCSSTGGGREIKGRVDGAEMFVVLSRFGYRKPSSEEISIDVTPWFQLGVMSTLAKPIYVESWSLLSIDRIDLVSEPSNPPNVACGGVYGGVHGA
jgi:hypothetical protein